MARKRGACDLRFLYELRKTKPLQARPSVGRLFWFRDRPGLVDASGILWPVALPQAAPDLATGDVIKFAARSRPLEDTLVSKYEDRGFLVTIEDISEVVRSLGHWPNGFIASPLPSAALLETLPDVAYTLYVSSAPQQRLKAVSTRNLGLQRTRAFFENRGFLHMETPTLVPSGGVEAYLNSFQSTYRDHRGHSWPVAMPTSPEFALKKLLAEGCGKIFQLSRSYRNGGELSHWHEPEFIMLEWYRTGGTLGDMMHDTRELVTTLGQCFGRQDRVPDRWPTYTVNSLFRDHLSLDLNVLQDRDDFYLAAKQRCLSIVESDDWDSLFYKLFMEFIEPFLKKQKACFVTQYPRQMSALARNSENANFVDRFEAYFEGVEICNGYLELTDPLELDRRFSSIEEQRAGDVVRDSIFEDTMRFGLPPCSGNALGIDRVIALLNGQGSIASLFPVPFLSQFPKGTVAEE